MKNIQLLSWMVNKQKYIYDSVKHKLWNCFVKTVTTKSLHYSSKKKFGEDISQGPKYNPYKFKVTKSQNVLPRRKRLNWFFLANGLINNDDNDNELFYGMSDHESHKLTYIRVAIYTHIFGKGYFLNGCFRRSQTLNGFLLCSFCPMII